MKSASINEVTSLTNTTGKYAIERIAAQGCTRVSVELQGYDLFQLAAPSTCVWRRTR